MALTDSPSPEKHSGDSSGLGKLVPLTSVGILIAALYAGYTVYSRHEASVDAEKAAEAKQQEMRQAQNESIFQHGELTITTFEASDATVRPGQTTQLCYGVVNAKEVKLDPQVEPTKPTARHCLDIAPKKTTKYTLTATGEAGQTKTANLTVQVR